MKGKGIRFFSGPKNWGQVVSKKQIWDYMIPGILKLTLQSLMNDISELWTANMAK